MSPRIGLALGGGAARGLAHLGVLDVLAEAGIRPDVVTGTSFGALAGAAVACAAGGAKAVERGVVAYVRSDSFTKSRMHFLRRQADAVEDGASYSVREAIRRGLSHAASPPEAQLVPPSEVEAAIEALLPDGTIESMAVRFGAVAADLESGEELLFDSGSLRLAVRASCAIPGLLPPVLVAGRRCVDGGWVEKVPVLAARTLGADVVVAVDVADELADTRRMMEGARIIHRADALQAARLKTLQLASADVVIRCDVAAFGWADFDRAAAIVAAGRAAAEEALPGVLALIGRASSPMAFARRILERAAAGMDEREQPSVVRIGATEG